MPNKNLVKIYAFMYDSLGLSKWKGMKRLGSPLKEKGDQVIFLKQRLNMFMDLLDEIEPENAELEDIDRLISIIDDLESKCREFKNRDDE